eukprot:6194249-Pleurochrysis_carterae.AAC.1
MRELVARKWLKSAGKYWGEQSQLQSVYFSKFLALCRQPAGRADGKRGSQQCAFEMDVPSRVCLQGLGLSNGPDMETGERSLLVPHPQSKYSVSETTGEIEWVPSRTIDTYYLDDEAKLAQYLSFHTREAARAKPAYGSSKAV